MRGGRAGAAASRGSARLGAGAGTRRAGRAGRHGSRLDQGSLAVVSGVDGRASAGRVARAGSALSPSIVDLVVNDPVGVVRRRPLVMAVRDPVNMDRRRRGSEAQQRRGCSCEDGALHLGIFDGYERQLVPIVLMVRGPG